MGATTWCMPCYTMSGSRDENEFTCPHLPLGGACEPAALAACYERRPRYTPLFVGLVREFRPVHVRDVQVVLHSPQLRRDAPERALAVVRQIHGQHRMIRRGERRAVGDEEH